MRVKIEINKDLEEEVIIRCKELTPEIKKIESMITQSFSNINLTFYKDSKEYYLPLNTLLFFETSQSELVAHTKDESYHLKSKLYELEQKLPKKFIRISKSTIVNTQYIYSIERNITSSSTIEFTNSHKQVYVSRNYYKSLKERINERRNYYEK